MEYGIYIGGATLAIAIIAYVARVTFWVSRSNDDLRDYMDAQLDNIQRDIIKLELADMNRADTIRREFGETGAALRTKIHEVETWNRDTFVRKDSFETVINRIEKSMEKAVDKIESRIEALFERAQHRPD